MPTDCSTVPAANDAASPFVASRLRVGVRHGPSSLCLRIACLDTPARPPGLEHGMAQVLDAAERLLCEAGSHRHRILSCELYVREAARAAEARSLLHRWMAGGRPTHQDVAPPAVHTHSQPHPQRGTAAAPLVEMVLVVAHKAGAGAGLHTL